MSHLTSHISHLTSHMSHLTSHISHVTSHMSHPKEVAEVVTNTWLTNLTCHVSYFLSRISYLGNRAPRKCETRHFLSSRASSAQTLTAAPKWSSFVGCICVLLKLQLLLQRLCNRSCNRSCNMMALPILSPRNRIFSVMHIVSVMHMHCCNEYISLWDMAISVDPPSPPFHSLFPTYRWNPGQHQR